LGAFAHLSTVAQHNGHSAASADPTGVEVPRQGQDVVVKLAIAAGVGESLRDTC